MEDLHVTLAHGNGGRLMRELIEEIFVRQLRNPQLDMTLDATPLDLTTNGTLCVTTDGFTVQPLEFPGGNIGSLAINGTVNDLAVSGAVPKFLTLSAIIEEGLEIAVLERIVCSLAATAREACIDVVAGDTKVVPRGAGGGLYLSTTGLGVRPVAVDLGLSRIRAGDRILVSGPVGDHGICVLLARESFDLRGAVRTDCAAVTCLTRPMAVRPGTRFMRDPTRGGLATVAHEIAMATGLTVRLDEASIPVRSEVRTVCDILGYDPYYLACEGRVVLVAAPEFAAEALAQWRSMPEGQHAADIGQVETGRPSVILATEVGGERLLEQLEDDPLPRIC
ncbi:MAG: hydrogenase expression/formation protein HypE [Alphaproteobacteria bacterium]|nr:hydrogenase expression/formation protein HypE [Alphaproteobacteria bacterium]